MGHEINPDIFRAYDIRGIAPDDLNEHTAGLIGVAFGNFLDRLEKKGLNPKTDKVLVCRDHRKSGRYIKKGLRIGLRKAGYSIVDIGVASTPEFYYAMMKHRMKAGLMITASHNAAKYNGIKLQIDKAVPLSGDTGIYEMRDMIEHGHIREKHIDKVLATEHLKTDIRNEYARYCLKKCRFKRKIKVIIDTGNGVVGRIPERILKQKGCDARTLFAKPDDRFPNHIADPHKEETLRWLQEEVVKAKADIGIALDGDGDRVGIVDDKGRVVETGKGIMLLARKALAKKRGKVVYGIRMSDAVIADTRKHGGSVVISRAGHSYIFRNIIKHDAIMGAEESGHIFYPVENYNYDDGIFAGIKLAEIASSVDSLSELVDSLPCSYPSPEISIRSTDRKKFGQVERLAGLLKKKGYKINTVDGVKVRFPNGWGLVRASNTTPHVKCRFEGKTHKDMIDVVSKMRPLMKKAGLKMRKKV